MGDLRVSPTTAIANNRDIEIADDILEKTLSLQEIDRLMQLLQAQKSALLAEDGTTTANNSSQPETHVQVLPSHPLADAY
jgi:hypothetical protein